MAQIDIEAGNHSLVSPAQALLARHSDVLGVMRATPTSVSSARDLTTLANQTQLRSRPEHNTISNQESQSSRPRNQFFDTLQMELEHGGREYCLFMCWEYGFNDQRAVPLLIKDSEDEVKVYQDLIELWYKTHGWWWRYVPLYQILAVEEVEFRFLRKQQNDYSIMIEKLDIQSIEAQLNRELAQAQDQIRLNDLDEFVLTCYQDRITGEWVHYNINDWTHDDHLFTCPFKIQLECERKLNHLKLLSLPLLFFRDPESAADQRTLQGLAQESCIYRTSEIKGTNYFESWTAEARTRGLMLRCGYTWKYRPLDVPAVAVTIVTLWKVSGGSWEAAFAAGGFFIMLISLSPMICK